MKECFTKSVEKIINHLRMLFSCNKLCGKKIGTILMVGGFSRMRRITMDIKYAFSNNKLLALIHNDFEYIRTFLLSLNNTF
jgi:molecular chaperone DnaK (HSP70)